MSLPSGRWYADADFYRRVGHAVTNASEVGFKDGFAGGHSFSQVTKTSPQTFGFNR
jgi:hypothetical protein